jgi:RES domain-containing protein
LIFRPELLDSLEDIEPRRFSGVVFRHVLGDTAPLRANTRGARWNPPDVSALYTSLERKTAIAEGDFLISLQPIRPSVTRWIAQIQITLQRVIEIDEVTLQKLGISREALEALDHAPCREIGGAVNWLGFEGLIVPSARSNGQNLVIYIGHQDPAGLFEVIGKEPL